MKASWLALPPPSRKGAVPLKTAMATASAPSVLRRPMRSASRPDSGIASAPSSAPVSSTDRNWPISCCEYSATHDSGKIVTRWNSAYEASAANAPMKML